ncbi:hypothetical protein LCGC14_0986500 [marine sediment metagenome]|uniref:Uncharacterized protein n=1 Tax=marine sediment metagenome TaxID=412755 RepID=A0A0F9RDR9_9ZZZZ
MSKPEVMPDQSSRLLKDKEIEKRFGVTVWKRTLAEGADWIAELQDAKTASIKDAEWGELMLKVLRKIGVANSDTDPTISEVIMVAEDVIEKFNPTARIEELIKDLMLLHYNLETWEWERTSKQNKWVIDKALTEIKRMYEELKATHCKANPTSEVEG